MLKSVLHTCSFAYFGYEQLSLCRSQTSSVTAFDLNICECFFSYLGKEALLFTQRGSTELQCSFSACHRCIFPQMQALRRLSCSVRSHRGILCGRLNTLQHLYFCFSLPIFIFSAVWDLASTSTPANLKEDLFGGDKSTIILHFLISFLQSNLCVCFLFFLSWQCLSTTPCGSPRSSG